MSRYLVTLSDVTPNRATVTHVRPWSGTTVDRETGRSLVPASEYAIVSDPALVPAVGERVWIASWSQSSGERTITGRQ